MAEPYDPQAVETKWQRRWAEQGAYQVDNDDPRPPRYVLCMYPYPSGPAHQGHIRNYTFGDLLVRKHTMQGQAVLSPIGFDSFGLPAENAAIKTGIHPRIFTEARIEELKSSLKRLGAVYDWRREIRSHDPLYMRWNQLIFLRFLEAGLAYRKNAPVNWCPGCHTVLANEQVLPDGTCERSGDLVVKRDLEQWFFRITAYADELLDALDEVDWPERVKTMQRNWIGRSEGAEFDLPIEGRDERIRVYTTRPDTSFGMTFVVLAPGAPAGRGDHHRRAPRRGDRLRRAGADRNRHRTPIQRGSAGQAGSLHRQLCHQPLHRTSGADLPGRLRLDDLRHRRHHGRSRSGPARLGFRHLLRPAHHPHRRPAGGLGGRGLHRRRAGDQQRVVERPVGGRCQGPGHRLAGGAGHR